MRGYQGGNDQGRLFIATMRQPTRPLQRSQGTPLEWLEEGRRGTVAVFEAPESDLRQLDDETAEIAFAGAWIA